jgi:L-ribulose-5-phosphate 4-epimerase
VARPSPETGPAELRRDLVLACRILGTNGHGDNIYGHVSARIPGSDHLLMKAHNVGLEEVTDDDLLVLDLDGNVTAGAKQRHTEYPIHTEILRARSDVAAVVHTHPIHSVAFGARGLRLRPVGHEGSYFWPPEVPLFDEFTDLVRTREQGEAVAKRLGDRPAVFLRNHGIAVGERSIAWATCAAILLEKAAQVQLLAQPADDASFSHTPEDEALRKRRIWTDESIGSMWRYYVRRLGPITLK